MKTCESVQVWNMNRVGGLVAVFNLQGSSWSRRARKYVTHDSAPKTLSAVVKPSHLPAFQACGLTFHGV